MVVGAFNLSYTRDALEVEFVKLTIISHFIKHKLNTFHCSCIVVVCGARCWLCDGWFLAVAKLQFFAYLIFSIDFFLAYFSLSKPSNHYLQLKIRTSRLLPAPRYHATTLLSASSPRRTPATNAGRAHQNSPLPRIPATRHVLHHATTRTSVHSLLRIGKTTPPVDLCAPATESHNTPLRVTSRVSEYPPLPWSRPALPHTKQEWKSNTKYPALPPLLIAQLCL